MDVALLAGISSRSAVPRPSVVVITEMTIADERTSDAQRMPLSSSAHPIASSSEISPGPVAASATATVASVSSN